ncbi:MAG: hypothetical protein ACRDWB_10055, partial [Acidimicrobiales bacterium]
MPGVAVAFVIAATLWVPQTAVAQTTSAPPTTAPPAHCASGHCPLNIGGTFEWTDTATSVSGAFAGSLVTFPRIAQVTCAAGAAVDTSSPGAATAPGGAPHPGVIIPFPFTAPGPGKPLAAYIDITSYHGPGTYTNDSFAHQTYAHPAGLHYSTLPADNPGTS